MTDRSFPHTPTSNTVNSYTPPTALQQTAIHHLNLKTEHFVRMPDLGGQAGAITFSHVVVGTFLTSFSQVVGGSVVITNQRKMSLNLVTHDGTNFEMIALKQGEEYVLQDGIFFAFDSMCIVEFAFLIEESAEIVPHRT